jgi:hypothetical protein
MDMHRRAVMAIVVSKFRELAWQTIIDLLICCAVSSFVNIPLCYSENEFFLGSFVTALRDVVSTHYC